MKNLKKRILVSLTLAMVLTAISAVGSACFALDPPALKLNSAIINVKSDTSGNVPGGTGQYSYDKASNTLTLTDFTGNYIKADNMNVTLRGKNVVLQNVAGPGFLYTSTSGGEFILKGEDGASLSINTSMIGPALHFEGTNIAPDPRSTFKVVDLSARLSSDTVNSIGISNAYSALTFEGSTSLDIDVEGKGIYASKAMGSYRPKYQFENTGTINIKSKRGIEMANGILSSDELVFNNCGPVSVKTSSEAICNSASSAGEAPTVSGLKVFANDGLNEYEAYWKAIPLFNMMGYKFKGPGYVDKIATHVVMRPIVKLNVKFVAVSGGTLNGTSDFSVESGLKFKNITPPTPTSSEGYKFVKWNPALPDGESDIVSSTIYTAEFEKQTTVTPPPATKEYTVRISSKMKNGTLSANKKSAAYKTKITIKAKPKKGYRVVKISVRDEDGDSVKLKLIKKNVYRFAMPKMNVSVKATFKR